MGNVFFAGKLPAFDEGVVHRAFKDDGAGEVIQAAGETRIGDLVTEILGSLHAVVEERWRMMQCRNYKDGRAMTCKRWNILTYTTSRLIPATPFFLKLYHMYNAACPFLLPIIVVSTLFK